MSREQANTTTRNPFELLGLTHDANADQVRAKYLELVKQFPPDRAPEKFRQIQAAYEAARDPLVLAKSLLELPDPEQPPPWQNVIDELAQQPPRMPVDFLLSLGNRSKSVPSTGQVESEQAGRAGDVETQDASAADPNIGDVDG